METTEHTSQNYEAPQSTDMPTEISTDVVDHHESDHMDDDHEKFTLRENIVGPAWELVSNSHFIKKFNFFPSLISTIYLGCIILYQLAFSYVYIFKLKDEFFGLVIEWVHTSYFWEFVGTLIIGIIIYILITPIAEGGLLSLIAKRQEKWKYESQDMDEWYGYGISRGLMSFLPIFELTNLLAVFKLLSIITFYIFLLRIFGKDYFANITIFMSVYLIFAFFVNILFSYARFFIIFEGKKALESLSLSVHMTLSNLWITFHLYFTLFLVYIRTFITAIIFIVFPFIVSGLLTYVTISWLQVLSIGVLSVLFIAFMVFISYLNSVLEIFVETIWYNAYRENKKHMSASEPSHGHIEPDHHTEESHH